MGIEDIPGHYVIMHQFVYQVGKVSGNHQSYMSPRRIAQKLQDLGWRRADHHRPTLDDEGNDSTVVRINQDSVWVKPEHWEHDPELRPPVQPKTPEAEEFLKGIVRGSRINYPTDVKEEIMDALVQFATDGKVKHWFGHGRGPERAAMIGRLDKQTDAPLPEGTEEQTLIPGPVLQNAVRKMSPDPANMQSTLEKVRKGLARLGYEQAMAHDRAREVWYHKKHWEAAIGGQLGLLPLTPEAEAYEARLSKAPTNSVQRYLPDASTMPEVEKIVASAVHAGPRAPSPEDLAAMRNRPSLAAQQAGFAKGGPGRPRKLPQGEPGQGKPFDPNSPEMKGKTAHAATGQRRKPPEEVAFADDDDDVPAEPKRRGRPPGSGAMQKMEPAAKKSEPAKDDRPTHAAPKKTGNAAWNALGDEDRSGGLDDDDDEDFEDDDVEFADDDE